MMPITPEELGRRLRLARKSRQISQQTAGAEIGRDQPVISRIESGVRPVSTLELLQLAALYGQPAEWFIDPRFSLGPEESDVAPDEDSAVLSLVRQCS
ncbi:MAG: helix-turn-helix transcriptional regulator [Gemmatimonadetes bacterium]|nr:helix-turn-helix transcriptional regulator [Gemmatimonadota bacterium]